MSISRRRMIQAMSVAAAAIAVGPNAAQAAEATSRIHLATNVYPWSVFYQREGRNFDKSLDAGLGEIASCGLDGFEPIINSPADVDRLAPLLAKHKLQMRSFYVNTTLHLPDEAKKSIEHVATVAAKAKQIGAKIVVTNPNPIRWGGKEAKDDTMLRTQAAAMNEIGARLAEIGMTLAYHNHDVELQNGAREFHHMMCGTDPKLITLCLDAHWIYRGCGNSAVAVFDVVKLYGRRISELHLRQSRKNIWTEEFGEGDIDYPLLAKELLAMNVRPHLVLEQAVEGSSPKTMNVVEAHRKGNEYARRVFAGFES